MHEDISGLWSTYFNSDILTFKSLLSHLMDMLCIYVDDIIYKEFYSLVSMYYDLINEADNHINKSYLLFTIDAANVEARDADPFKPIYDNISQILQHLYVYEAQYYCIRNFPIERSIAYFMCKWFNINNRRYVYTEDLKYSKVYNKDKNDLYMIILMYYTMRAKEEK